MNSDLENEEWRDIPGYKAKASTLGRIMSLYGRKPKIRKLQKGLRGKYLRVQFINRGPYLSVHRLVAMAFHENPENYPLIRHLDNDGTNNKPSNLAWGNQSQNIKEGRKGCVNRPTNPLVKRVIKEAYQAGFSKLSIGNYFRITDTSVRRLVNS